MYISRANEAILALLMPTGTQERENDWKARGSVLQSEIYSMRHEFIHGEIIAHDFPEIVLRYHIVHGVPPGSLGFLP